MAIRFLMMFWSLLPMAVPLVAQGLGSARSRVDPFFFAASGSGVLLLLLALLLPQGEVPLPLAWGASFCVSGVIALAYLALVPSARGNGPGLLAVLGIVDVAVLLAGQFALTAHLSTWGVVGVVLVSGAIAGNGAVWALRWLRRVRGAGTRS